MRLRPASRQISTRRNPASRKISAVTNFMPMAPIAETKVIMPDWNGVSPKPIWNISGNRNGTAPMPMRNSAAAKHRGAEHLVAEQFERQQRIFGVARMQQIERARQQPDRHGDDTGHRRQGRQADHRQAEHHAGCRQPAQHEADEIKWRRARMGSVFGRKRVASQMPIRPIGTLIRKIQCQVK